jgi:hypothetical protein
MNGEEDAAREQQPLARDERRKSTTSTSVPACLSQARTPKHTHTHKHTHTRTTHHPPTHPPTYTHAWSVLAPAASSSATTSGRPARIAHSSGVWPVMWQKLAFSDCLKRCVSDRCRAFRRWASASASSTCPRRARASVRAWRRA